MLRRVLMQLRQMTEMSQRERNLFRDISRLSSAFMSLR